MAIRDFDGTGDYLDCEFVDTTGAFFVMAVVKREANGAWHTILSNQTTANSYRMALAFSNTDRLQGAIQTSAAVQISCNSGTGTGTFTVQAADGWVIVAWSKPAGSGAGTLSVFKGGAWTHCTPPTSMGNPDVIGGGGKMRVGVFEAADDPANARFAMVCVAPGLNPNTTAIDALDGLNASTLEAALGVNAAGGDILELAHNAAAAANTAWGDLTTSVNGRLDVTATAGNGTIVTGDDPGATIYTVGSLGAAGATSLLAPPFRYSNIYSR